MNGQKIDGQKLESLKNQLIVQHKNLSKTLKTMKENGEAKPDPNTPGELSNYDNHPADLGSQLYELEQNMALKTHEESLRGEVEDALERIDKGIYGVCESCGRNISEERLEAIPYTRFCIECAKESEKEWEFMKKQRPNEERVMRDSPFGRKYLGKSTEYGVGGLDYLDTLEEYGSSDSPQDMGGSTEHIDFYKNKVDISGIVDEMDRVSNEEYERQLPD